MDISSFVIQLSFDNAIIWHVKYGFNNIQSDLEIYSSALYNRINGGDTMNYRKEMRNIECDRKYILYSVRKLRLSEQSEAYILHYILYAIRKCELAKILYYTFTICTIIFPILITMLQGLSKSYINTLVPVFSAITSITAALLPIFRSHDKWTRYRGYVEESISILMEIQIKLAGQKNAEEVEKELINRFVKLNEEHHRLWNNERNNDIKPTGNKSDQLDNN